MKTAWIFPGGAARGVYTAGALYALCKMNIEKPDIIIAASSSAPTSLCYVTGQYEIIPKVWLNYLSTRKFVSFFRFWNIVNIDYLIDFVLKKENPLDMKKVQNSDIKIYIPLTNGVNGKINYFTNKTTLDMWEIIRASVYVPIFSNLFSFKGTLVKDQYFSDSSPLSRFQLHVIKAIEEGMDKVIVFDSWNLGDNPKPLFWSKVFAHIRNRQFRENQLKYIKQIENFIVPKNIELVILGPIEKLNMNRFEINNLNAKKVFQRGFDDTFNNLNLRRQYENY